MIQQKGYRLFMQPVGTAGYSDEDLIHLIKRINRLQPYAFYLVDTLGTMYGKSFLRQVSLADHNLAPSIRLGSIPTPICRCRLATPSNCSNTKPTEA